MSFAVKCFAAALLCFFLQGGCVSVVIDPSMNAAQANDRTLVITGCGLPNSPGAETCRVIEGEAVASSVQLLVPGGNKIKAGEVTVLFKDIEKTFAANSEIVNIRFSDVFGPGNWDVEDHDGEMVVLGRFLYEDGNGVEKTIHALGLVRIFVLRSSYPGPLPFGSGYQAWEGTYKCIVQCSTAGRCASKCSK